MAGTTATRPHTDDLGTTPTTAVVEALGNPVTPATNPPAPGRVHRRPALRERVRNPAATLPAASRTVRNAARQAGTNLDPNRKALDTTGYVTKVLGQLPTPNNYDVGDGLNTAGYRWVRHEKNGTENIFGYNGNLARKQINTKIDHTVNNKNKLGVSYTYEDSSGNANYSTLPNGFQGSVFRHPQTLVGQFHFDACRRRLSTKRDSACAGPVRIRTTP